MTVNKIKVVVRCPHCNWRIFDKVTQASGIIEIKCPNCNKVVPVDLSLRKTVKYRLVHNTRCSKRERMHNRIR